MSYGELTLAGQEWTWNSNEEATSRLQMRREAMKTPVLDLEGILAGPGEEEREKVQYSFVILAGSVMKEPGSLRSSAEAPIKRTVGQGGVRFCGKGF